jgi:hypothetical protein
MIMIGPVVKSSASFNMTEKGNDKEIKITKKGVGGAVFDEMFNRELVSLDKYGRKY